MTQQPAPGPAVRGWLGTFPGISLIYLAWRALGPRRQPDRFSVVPWYEDAWCVVDHRLPGSGDKVVARNLDRPEAERVAAELRADSRVW